MTVMLSRLDLADDEVRRDAEADLRRAELGGGAALEAWARKWARPALDSIEELATEVAGWLDGEGDECA